MRGNGGRESRKGEGEGRRVRELVGEREGVGKK